MADSTRPSRFQKGDPIPATELNKHGEGIVQSVRMTGTREVRRVGTHIVMDMQAGRGGAKKGFLATLKTCPSGGNDAVVTSLDTEEDVHAYLPTGSWTHINESCFVVPMRTYGGLDWFIIDLPPWNRCAPATGEYETVTGTLANIQYGPSPEACGG